MRSIRWSDRDPVWGLDTWDPKNHVLDGARAISKGGGHRRPTVMNKKYPAWVTVFRLVAAAMRPCAVNSAAATFHVCSVSFAKTNVPIDISFGHRLVGPRNHVLGGARIPHGDGHFWGLYFGMPRLATGRNSSPLFWVTFVSTFLPRVAMHPRY